MASAETVAGFRRRFEAPQEEVHHRTAVEWKCRAAQRYGKNAGLPWDLILGAEVAKHYKPDKEAYLTAVDLLGMKPEEVMITAAHIGDLNAARSFGLRTAFIHRPNEYGPTRQADKATPGQFDVVAKDMLDLAAQLGT